MKHSTGGFTLLEALLVLFVVMTIIGVVMSFSYSQWKEAQYEQAIEKFRLTLHQAQMAAIQEQTTVNVYIVDKKYVKTSKSFFNYDLTWEIPNGMSITIYTNKTYITFTPLGNVRELGKVEFQTPERKMVYSINMSKGRLRLIE